MARPRKTPAKTPEALFPAEHIGCMGDNSVNGEFLPDGQKSDRDLIASTLRQIMQDATAPAAARAQAARTMAEMVGALGRHATPPTEEGKPLGEMTRAELEAELLRS